MTPDPWANDWAAEGLRALIPQTEGIKQLLQQGLGFDRYPSGDTYQNPFSYHKGGRNIKIHQHQLDLS